MRVKEEKNKLPPLKTRVGATEVVRMKKHKKKHPTRGSWGLVIHPRHIIPLPCCVIPSPCCVIPPPPVILVSIQVNSR